MADQIPAWPSMAVVEVSQLPLELLGLLPLSQRLCKHIKVSMYIIIFFLDDDGKNSARVGESIFLNRF